MSAADELTLSLTVDGRDVDARCSVKANMTSKISHVISLVLSRVSGNSEEVLTLASCHPHDNENLLGATKTSELAENATSESFINLHWENAAKDLEGVYKCEAHAIDKENNQVMLEDTTQLILTENPALTVVPKVIYAGVTREIVLKCSTNDVTAIGVKNVLSIGLKAVRNDVGVVLASVDIFSGTEQVYSSEDAQVTSSLGGKQNDLSMTWKYPGLDKSGHYVCEITATNQKNESVHFLKSIDINVQEGSLDEIISDLKSVEAERDNLVSQVQVMKQDLSNNQITINNLSKDLQFWEYLPRDCSNFNLTQKY